MPWRIRAGRFEVAVVHRPKYDDWSWPKGKLDPGETWPVAAVRETREEIGFVVQLGRTLPQVSYRVREGAEMRPKVVRYWAAQVADLVDRRSLPRPEEVDEIRWLRPAAAARLLTQTRDQAPLESLMLAWRSGRAQTWPLVLIRHARAVPRKRWRGPDDADRPLNDAGRRQAALLVPLLQAFGPNRVLSSGAVRCIDTVRPFARIVRLGVRSNESLSECGCAADPDQARALITRVFSRGKGVAICTHRPVLPVLIRRLAEAADGERREVLRESSGPGLVKGEVLVAHVHGAGDSARIVDVERHTA
ncbi:MAG: NUDIX hydrolase [Actinomycetota bacterium]